MRTSAYMRKTVSRHRMSIYVLICGLAMLVYNSACVSTKNAIDRRQKEIVAKFKSQKHWTDKMQLLIDIGMDYEPFGKEHQTSSNLVEGCSTKVWIVAVKKDGKLHYYGYTDSLVLNGVLVVLFNVFNDSSPTDILSARFGFFDKLRIKEHLSSTRCVDVDIIIEKILSIAKSNL